MTLPDIRRELKKKSDPKKAKILKRFFKTGPGEYGEGDRFVGVKMSELRTLAQKYRTSPIRDVLYFLRSPVHEERMLALLILIKKYRESTEEGRRKIFKIYLRNTKYINSWDLIDVTAEHIIGDYLVEKKKEIIYRLAGSDDMWERRIAVLSTFHYIKQGTFDEALKVADMLKNDTEDLIHKAVGWMLRETGKRDQEREEKFLKKRYKKMPRTMLRYAIERFQEKKRKAYLKGEV